MHKTTKITTHKPLVPRKPIKVRLTTQDTTKESLVTLMNANQLYGFGIAIWNDELAYFLEGLNQYKRHGNDMEYFLQSWTKGLQNIVRKSDKTDITIYASHNIIGTIQPKVLDRTLFKGGIESSNGLIERFLYCTSDYEEQGFSLEDNPEYMINSLEAICKNIFSYICESGLEIGHEYLIDDKAQKKFINFCNKIVEYKKSNKLSDLEKNYIQKQTNYVARFSLIRHVMDNYEQETIPADIVDKSIKLSQYFIYSFRNIVNTRSGVDTKEEYALNYLLRKELKCISPTQLFKSNDSKFRTVDKAKITLENLAKKGYGRVTKAKNGVKFIFYGM